MFIPPASPRVLNDNFKSQRLSSSNCATKKFIDRTTGLLNSKLKGETSHTIAQNVFAFLAPSNTIDA